jgi:hypothetical protein
MRLKSLPVLRLALAKRDLRLDCVGEVGGVLIAPRSVDSPAASRFTIADALAPDNELFLATRCQAMGGARLNGSRRL